MGLATSSGVLYCSYDGLARAARVSPRSAHSIRAELERLGVLERVRTGGRAEDGSRQSNKYIVKWDKLRDILGIACCYASNWHGELQRTVERKPFHNVYYNYEGYAHYSKSARQKRRERQRARRKWITMWRKAHQKKGRRPWGLKTKLVIRVFAH